MKIQIATLHTNHQIIYGINYCKIISTEQFYHQIKLKKIDFICCATDYTAYILTVGIFLKQGFFLVMICGMFYFFFEKC